MEGIPHGTPQGEEGSREVRGVDILAIVLIVSFILGRS